MNTFLRCTIALVAIGMPLVAQAQPTGSEIPVNTTTADSQSRARAAMDGSGRLVVVWQSLNQDANPGYGVYLQRFSIAGAPLGGEVQVNVTPLGSQKLPAVSTSDAGAIVVVWEGDDVSGRGIFARLFSAAGAPLTGEISVNSTTAGDQLRPTVAMKSTGEFVVVWDGPDANGSGVFGRRFNAAGAPQGSEFALNTATLHDQTRPVVAIDSSGRFYAAWESNLQDGSGLGVYARRFEADGLPRDASEFLVNLFGFFGNQELPAIAAAQNGDFVVAWQGAGTEVDMDGGIFAQRYLQNGAPQGGEFHVNPTLAGLQHGVDAAMDANGNFVLAWSGPDAAGEGVFGLRYRADGTPMGGEFAANVTTAGAQTEAAVAMNRRLQPLVDSQVFALAWTSPDAAVEGITARLGSFGNSVTVLAPDDGRTWAVGSSQRIRFAHTLPAATREFKIELIVNAGPPTELQANYLANRTVGNYQYAPVLDPGSVGPYYGKIRVTSTVDPAATDDSVPFPIEAPTITMLQPPPDVIQGVPNQLKWAQNLGLQSHVRIDLARDGSLFTEVVSADVTNAWVHEGSFSWSPTGTCDTLGSCKLKVTSLDDAAVFGISAPFDITVIDVIFVNNTAPGGGNGSYAAPYNTMGPAESAAGVGKTIFVFAGNGTSTGYTGFTMKAQQKLIGEGAGLVVNGITVVPAGQAPKITSFNDVIILNVDNEVAGVVLQPTAGRTALSRQGDLGTALFRNSTIELGSGAGSRSGIRLDTTPAGTLTLDTITMSGVSSGSAIFIDGGAATLTGSNGLSLAIDGGRLLDLRNAVGGGVSLTGGTLTSVNMLNQGVLISNNPGTTTPISVTLDNLTLSSLGTEAALEIFTNHASSSITLNDLDVSTANSVGLTSFNSGAITINPGATGSTINATGRAAIELGGASPGAFAFNGTFATVSSTNSSGGGLSFNGTNGTINFSAAGGSISGSNFTPFSVFAGSGAIHYGGSVSKTSGVATSVASVSSRTGGSVTLSGNIACSGPCNGISVDNNNGGGPKTITFSGASKQLDTGASPVLAAGVSLSNNAGATISFTNGGLAITTTTATGFNAQNGAAAINVTGPGNTVTKIGGCCNYGVNIDNTPIGTVGPDLGVTFDSVSVAAGTNTGIRLTNAGNGPFVANGGSLTGVTDRGVVVFGGAGDVTYAGSIATQVGGPNAFSVEVASRTGGAVTLSGNIEDRARGILLSNNSSGSPVITFSGGSKIVNSTSNALQITNNGGATIEFNNGGLDVDTGNGAALIVTGSTLSVNGSGNTIDTTGGAGIILNNGNLTVGGSLAVTTAGNGAALTAANTATISGSGLSLNAAAGIGLDASSPGTTISITGANHSISAGTGGGAGTAVNFVGTTIPPLGVTLASVSANGAASGILLTNVVGSGPIIVNGGALLNVTNRGLDIQGGSGNVTYGGAITTNGGRSVEITSRSVGGAVVLSGPITDSHQGIVVSGNSGGGSVLFSGPLTLNTGTNQAFQATFNTGGPTIEATGGGTITTTTGTAVNIANTTVGASGVTFTSISANGAVNGIVLNGTGAGAFTVTGNTGGLCGGDVTGSGAIVTAPDAGDCSGGVIQGTTGPGVLLTSTGPVSLTRMRIASSGDDGIQGTLTGTGVNGFTLASSLIENNGNGVGERGIDMVNLGGNGAITQSTVRGSFHQHVLLNNTTATLSSFPITNSQFSTTSLAPGTGDDGIQLLIGGTGTMTASVTQSAFTDNRNNHFRAASTGAASGSITIDFSNNTLLTTSANDASVLGGGITINPLNAASITFTIANNNIQQAFASAINVNHGTSSTAAGVLSGTISGNTIGTAADPGSGSENANGITVVAQGAGATIVAVTNNTIHQWANDHGIFLRAINGSGNLDATVTGNTLSNPDPVLSLNGIAVTAGATATDNATLCADVTGNDATGAGTSGLGNMDIALLQAFLTTIRLPGYVGGNSDTAAVNAFVAANNDPAGPTAAPTVSSAHNVGGGGGGFVGGGSCLIP